MHNLSEPSSFAVIVSSACAYTRTGAQRMKPRQSLIVLAISRKSQLVLTRPSNAKSKLLYGSIIALSARKEEHPQPAAESGTVLVRACLQL
jgi:hypothetical protein